MNLKNMKVVIMTKKMEVFSLLKELMEQLKKSKPKKVKRKRASLKKGQ